uniref:Uncharacterized protein n=1 Tax=Chelonoidis abingdonii TaxID=106734 RepID=A0A8C0FXB5_CHEAB
MGFAAPNKQTGTALPFRRPQHQDFGGWQFGDPRVRLLGECMVRSLRPEAQPLLRGFLEGTTGQPPLLLVTLSLARQLALSIELPASPGSGKVLFFLCRGPGPLSAPPGPRELLYGDLPASSLEHFAALVEELRGPHAGHGEGRLQQVRRGAARRGTPYPSSSLPHLLPEHAVAASLLPRPSLSAPKLIGAASLGDGRSEAATACSGCSCSCMEQG